MEWAPQTADKDAAWDMYIELLTRVTTQPISQDAGIEQTALESIYAIFGITREIIKKHGRDCEGFTRIAIVILNQIIRPFTAKWHKLSGDGAFSDKLLCVKFREELDGLQSKLTNYCQMLSTVAGVEDLTKTEE